MLLQEKKDKQSTGNKTNKILIVIRKKLIIDRKRKQGPGTIGKMNIKKVLEIRMAVDSLYRILKR